MQSRSEADELHFGGMEADAAPRELKPATLDDFDVTEFLDAINGTDAEVAATGEYCDRAATPPRRLGHPRRPMPRLRPRAVP